MKSILAALTLAAGFSFQRFHHLLLRSARLAPNRDSLASNTCNGMRAAVAASAVNA